MLRLTRKRGEIVILHKDGEIIALIEVMDTAFNKNKLGFYANRDIQIDRYEIAPDDLKAKARQIRQIKKT